MRLALPILWLMTACGPKVAVQVAGNPAVALPDSAVAVVAQDRSCQALADALVEALWAAEVPVDPRANTRVEVAVCGDDLKFDVEQHVNAEAPDAIERRTQATARAHGLVIVSENDVLQAHLIGVGRHQTAHGADRTGPLGAIGRTARLSAIQDAAQDLSEQLSPSPVTVDRRVWPNAPESSHRGLTTKAVWAEQRGDMGEALTFAAQAYDRRPNDRGARYVADLERRGRTVAMSMDSTQ